jgi:hypothetical protein
LRQYLCIHFRNCGIKSREIADINNRIAGTKFVVIESAMRQFTVKGHLAALKTWTDRTAGTSALALTTARGRFTVTAAFAAANAFLAVYGTGDIF